jgi:hypothetical protein
MAEPLRPRGKRWERCVPRSAQSILERSVGQAIALGVGDDDELHGKVSKAASGRKLIAAPDNVGSRIDTSCVKDGAGELRQTV